MKRKVAVIIFSMLIIIGMIAIAGIADVLSTRLETEEEIVPTEFEKIRCIENLSFIEAGVRTEGSLCLIAPEGEPLIFYQVILNEYIYCRKIKGKRYPLPEGNGIDDYIDVFDEDILELYNFRTGEVEKTLDLVTIAEENTPGRQFSSWDIIYGKVVDGRRCIGWKVYAIDDPYNYRTMRATTYDLDADKVVRDVNLIPSRKYTEEEVEYYKYIFILEDQRFNFLECNNLVGESTKTPIEEGGIDIRYVNSWRDGIIEVEMLVEMLPRNNAKLYAEFPELKGYNGKEGDRVKLFFAGYPSAEEIIEMLIEDGAELTYEGCIMLRGGSIDGKRHQISSVNDYIKWRDWEQVDPELDK